MNNVTEHRDLLLQAWRGIRGDEIRLEVAHAMAVCSEWTGSYVTTQGTLQIPLRPALNRPTGSWEIRAKGLSCGRSAVAKLTVN